MDRRRFIIGLGTTLLSSCGRSSRRLPVGSKNFTEQLILGELLAQVLEAKTHAQIERRFYLAGTYICQQAILAGRIDVYAEYTGTALTAILKLPAQSDSRQVFGIVQREYQRRFNLAVLPSLGFDNTFAVVMRGDDAKSHAISRLSQLAQYAPKLRIGVGYEFLERPDGFAGLSKTYGLRFAAAPSVMDLGLLYRALLARQVDVVVGSNTDGMIAALGLTVLEDDRHYFPPYEAVPIVRPQALHEFSGMQSALAGLAGRITTDEMRRMNYEVDGRKRDAADVARDFIAAAHLT